MELAGTTAESGEGGENWPLVVLCDLTDAQHSSHVVL